MSSLFRHRAGQWLAGTYLTVAAVGAWTAFPYRYAAPLNDAVYALMDLTASNNHFGFFAPAVSSQVRVDVQFTEADGHTEQYDLWSNSDEVNFRLNSVITTSMSQPVLRDVYARSWAASLLSSRPTARQVTLVAYVNKVPTMAEYRAGARPSWWPFYEGVFERTANR